MRQTTAAGFIRAANDAAQAIPLERRMAIRANDQSSVEAELQTQFGSARCEGFLCARQVDGDGYVGHNADALVVTASVFKIPVMLELARRCASGEIDPCERVRVGASDRVLGPTGLSAFLDDVECTWRDLGYLMMSVSDNTATDVVMRRLGLDAINATLLELGLERTTLVGDCRELLGSLEADTGLRLRGDERIAHIDPEVLARWRSLDPEQTSRTTPDEITRLLALIWRDEAGPADACAEVRRIMALQVWPHRLTQGFPDGVTLAAKTGTLPGIRNEAGVVTYPDGKRYAVAVFTRAKTYIDRQPMIDRVIGTAAHMAVEALRA